MISTPFSRSHPSNSKTSVSDRPKPVQRHHLHAVALLEGSLQAIQPRPVPRGPAPHVLEDLLAVGQHPALVLQVVGVGVAGHRHAGVSKQFSAHILLAPGSGMAASYYDCQSSGYAHIRPFLAMLARSAD